MIGREVDRILISGATGVLGSRFLAHLISNVSAEVEIVCVVRGLGRGELIRSALGPENTRRVTILVADLSDEDAILRAARQLNHVARCIGVHAAADVRWHKGLEHLRLTNVNGTLGFGELLSTTSDDAALLYVSSAYTSRGVWNFRNDYERTKAEADDAVRLAFANMRVSTFSPALIVGDSRTGAIGAFHGLYPLIDVLAMPDIPFMIGRREARLDIVPIDWVVGELCRATARMAAGEDPGDIVAAAGEGRVGFGELVEAIKGAVYALDGRGTPADCQFISFRRWDFLVRSVEQWDVRDVDRDLIRYGDSLIQRFRPYIDNDSVLSPTGISVSPPDIREYLPQIVRYWWTHGRRFFDAWKKDGRTQAVPVGD